MASPQIENGYTKIANELFEALIGMRIPGQEMRVVMAIIRKTYGYNKIKDVISYGQISKLTNIPRVKVIVHVKSLIAKNILHSSYNGTRKPLTMWINKNYAVWVDSPKKDTSPKEGTTDSPNKGNKPSPNKGTHKRKKEIITKEINKLFFLFCDIPYSKIKYSRDIKKFTHDYIDYISEKKKAHAPKKEKSLYENSFDTIDKLIRLDGFSLDYIRKVLLWAETDDFWKKNIYSLSSLRNKRNDLTKFQKIAIKYEGDINKSVKYKQPTLEDQVK